MKGKRITRDTVEHIAWLAHIELSDEEKNLLTEQFNKILDYFEVIDEVDTENVPPTYHVLDLVNIFRDDMPENPMSREEALRNASEKEDGFFKAPRIV